MIGRLKYSRDSIVLETSVFEAEMATEKLKRHKSPGSDQIPAQCNKASNIKKSLWNP